MREIKFRGKPTENNTSYFEDEDFVYGSLIISEDKYYILLDVLDNIKRDDYAVYMVEVRPETLGQYTGLKDKNEKEIYEGDILELNKDGRIFYGTSDGLLAKKYQLVGFKDGAFMTCRNKHLIDDYDTYLWIISKYSTVAGNIYDNPELLEEGE